MITKKRNSSDFSFVDAIAFVMRDIQTLQLPHVKRQLFLEKNVQIDTPGQTIDILKRKIKIKSNQGNSHP